MTGTNAIRAELIGSDTAAACGLRAGTVLALCRALVAGPGHDPNTPLVAARGTMPCLLVPSLGEAARFEISSNGTGLTAYRPRSRPQQRRR
jgi:hypothetical protein